MGIEPTRLSAAHVLRILERSGERSQIHAAAEAGCEEKASGE
jgi:hypothetical protein